MPDALAPSAAVEGRIFWWLRGQLFGSMFREAFSTARLRTTVLAGLMGLFWVARMGGFVWDRTVEGATPAPLSSFPVTRTDQDVDVVA